MRGSLANFLKGKNILPADLFARGLEFAGQGKASPPVGPAHGWTRPVVTYPFVEKPLQRRSPLGLLPLRRVPRQDRLPPDTFATLAVGRTPQPPFRAEAKVPLERYPPTLPLVCIFTCRFAELDSYPVMHVAELIPDFRNCFAVILFDFAG